MRIKARIVNAVRCRGVYHAWRCEYSRFRHPDHHINRLGSVVWDDAAAEAEAREILSALAARAPQAS